MSLPPRPLSHIRTLEALSPSLFGLAHTVMVVIIINKSLLPPEPALPPLIATIRLLWQHEAEMELQAEPLFARDKSTYWTNPTVIHVVQLNSAVTPKPAPPLPKHRPTQIFHSKDIYCLFVSARGRTEEWKRRSLFLSFFSHSKGWKSCILFRMITNHSVYVNSMYATTLPCYLVGGGGSSKVLPPSDLTTLVIVYVVGCFFRV